MNSTCYSRLRVFQWSSVALTLALSTALLSGAPERGKAFGTPAEAVAALARATATQDADALRAIFGPAAADLENPDRVQATNEFNAFTAALNTTNRLVHESDRTCWLVVGNKGWPFPIPLVKSEGRWFFDTAAGKEELLRRRLGKNELDTLHVMRAYVAAQREYAARDRNGDGVLEYAQSIMSSPGKEDGLYWPPGPDREFSPLGPLVAQAQAQGYTVRSQADHASPVPFHGYYFKLLTRQGRHAPGGKYDYIINGHMIGGFALVAWPASYGDSGIMTFIVNQQGRVYQKNLGLHTDKQAKGLKAYDPDPTWHVSPD